MDYNAPSFSTDPNASYVGKTASTLGSKVPPKAAEYPQREIVHAIKGTGQTASNNDLTQLLQAISIGAIPLGTFGGTADALTATMPGSAAGTDPVIVPALKPGMRVKGLAAYVNATSTPKLTLTGVAAAGGTVVLPIVGADGVTPVAIGAWKVGQYLTFEIDAAGNARLSGGTSDPSTIVRSALFPYFRAQNSANFTAPSGVDTGFTGYAAAVGDPNVAAGFNPANSVFTVPVGYDGLWLIKAYANNIALNALPQTTIGARMLKNGAVIEGITSPSGNIIHLPLVVELNLVAGDTVQYVAHPNESGDTLSFFYMSAIRLGRSS